MDWSKVNYLNLNDSIQESLDWTKVDFRKASKSPSFSTNTIDWNEINKSRSARNIYRAVDWSKVDYQNISSSAKDSLDWTQVEFREATRSDSFSIDSVDWDEINKSRSAKSIYKYLKPKHFADSKLETQLKLEQSGFMSKKLRTEIKSKANNSVLDGSQLEPFINVSDLDFNKLELRMKLSSDTDNDVKVGLYQIQNEEGAVKDPVTGALIYPGSTGYEAAALLPSNVLTALSNKSNVRTKSSEEFEEDTTIKMLAPFIENESLEATYFSFNEANAEDKHYFKNLGNGTLGVKDHFYNQDFDDLLIGFDVLSF